MAFRRGIYIVPTHRWYIERTVWLIAGGVLLASTTLAALVPRLAAGDVAVALQELVPGPETAIESYHVYVGAQGETVGEFTGRKIRTVPAAYGHSTALQITEAADVAALGRELVRRLGLRGVAKLDFKRAPSGELFLLEINARFNLWHHPGAVAGVNLPALVYGDLVGLPRGAPPRAEDPEDDALLFYTSGTTSFPKGVPLTHANILANVRDVVSFIEIRRDDCMIGFLPPFHSFGLTVTMIAPLVQLCAMLSPNTRHALGISWLLKSQTR